MPSKMVTDRQALGAQVSAAIDTHAGEAAAALDRQVRSLLGEGVTELEGLLGTVRRMFDRHLALLVEADEAHLATVGNLADPRRGRDDASFRLYSALIEVRRLAEGLYGERAEELLRLGGPVSRNPVVLLRQARRVVARVGDPGTPRPEKRFDSASVDEAEWLERLEPDVEALDQALSRVRFGRRQMESTLMAKNEALAAYDVAFGRTARFMEALLDLSGLPSFASRLRPPVTRRGGAGDGVVIELPQPAPPAEPEAPDGPVGAVGSGEPVNSGAAGEPGGPDAPQEEPLAAVG